MATAPAALTPEYLAADQGPKLNAIVIVCFTLAVVAVCLRFLARIIIRAPLWFDDYMILVALFFAIGPFALTLYLTGHGFGKHAEVAGTADVISFYKSLYVFEILYPFPIAATKFSILFYYRRIFQVQSFKIPLYIVAGLIGCWLIYVEGSAIFTCVPIHAMWDPTVKGKCIDIHKFFIGIAVPNIVTDIALLTMPIPYMWKLQISIYKKLAVISVFVLGGFVAIVSIIRLTVLLSLGQPDPTWIYVPTCIWTNIEVHIGIVSASVPALWPLLRAIVTGHVRGGSTTRGQSVAELNRPSRNGNGNSTRQYSNRKKIGDDEEEFLHLDDMSAESQIISKVTEIRVAEHEMGPPVPSKAHVAGKLQGWRE